MTAVAEVKRVTRRPGSLLSPANWVDREAVADVAPVLIAIAPFAAVIGVQASAYGRTAGSLAGTLLLYAGSAQVSTLTLLHQGAGIVSILLAVALINARFVAYSASLAPQFAGQPTWFRLLAPHFVIDQTFAVVAARHDLVGGARFRRYWLTCAAIIAFAWVTAMAAGSLLGPWVPQGPVTAFMPAAALIVFLIPMLTDRAGVVAMTVGALTAVAPLSPGTRVLLGTSCGALAGLVTSWAKRR